MPDASPKSILEEIASLLCANSVEFLVIGGQAEYLFGSPRTTEDVDICYRRDPANIERLARCLQELYARLRGAPAGLPFKLDAKAVAMGCNFTFDTEKGKFDVLGYVELLGQFEQLDKNAEVCPDPLK
jgi:hypothetical protein